MSVRKKRKRYPVGKELFEWLIAPVSVDEFFSDYWEKKPLIIKRDNVEYYSTYFKFTKEDIDEMLREEELQYGPGRDIDVVRFNKKTGKKETLNANQGTADADEVQQLFDRGCSVRIVHPERFSNSIWRLNAGLQPLFGCTMGANTYLTPGNTQGFAPHYDDVEVFIVQTEGSKRWRLYKSMSEDSVLPRVSSADFTQAEIGNPVEDVVLQQGDLMYFPRGTIHQAAATESHSLHVTVSAYQMSSMFDALMQAIPDTLENLAATDIDFRRGLPVGYLDYMGVTHEPEEGEEEDARRVAFRAQMKKLMTKVVENVAWDRVCDQRAVDFLNTSLPPYLTAAEKQGSFNGGKPPAPDGLPDPDDLPIKKTSVMRLVRPNVARLCVEGDKLVLYHSMRNTRKYREAELTSLEFELDDGPALEFLLGAYPKGVKVADIPADEWDDQLSIAGSLFVEGLLVIERPAEAKPQPVEKPRMGPTKGQAIMQKRRNKKRKRSVADL